MRAKVMIDSMLVDSVADDELEDNERLRKADEFLTYSREKEGEARRELDRAVAQTKLAKEKWETLFAECEKRAVARRKAGLIVNRLD